MRGLSIVISPILVIIILLCYLGYSFSEDMTFGDQKIDKEPINIKADKLEFDSKRIHIQPREMWKLSRTRGY